MNKSKKHNVLIVQKNSNNKSFNFSFGNTMIFLFFFIMVGVGVFLGYVAANYVYIYEHMFKSRKSVENINKKYFFYTREMNEIILNNKKTDFYISSLLKKKSSKDKSRIWGIGGEEIDIDVEKELDKDVEIDFDDKLNYLRTNEILSKINSNKFKKVVLSSRNIISKLPVIFPIRDFNYAYILKKDNIFLIDVNTEKNNKILSVFSAGNGVISDVVLDENGKYNVKISFLYGLGAVYKGLDRVLVNKTDKVKSGEKIGYIREHLEYSLLEYDDVIDPSDFIILSRDVFKKKIKK